MPLCYIQSPGGYHSDLRKNIFNFLINIVNDLLKMPYCSQLFNLFICLLSRFDAFRSSRCRDIAENVRGFLFLKVTFELIYCYNFIVIHRNFLILLLL